jgi:hypothetical protein
MLFAFDMMAARYPRSSERKFMKEKPCRSGTGREAGMPGGGMSNPKGLSVCSKRAYHGVRLVSERKARLELLSDRATG